MNAAEHDDLGFGIPSFLREPERIALEVGDPVEDLGNHVVVPEDHRVPDLLQAVDLGDEWRSELPLEARDALFHLLVYVFGRLGDRVRILQSLQHFVLRPHDVRRG